jgi:hypothetical protein
MEKFVGDLEVDENVLELLPDSQWIGLKGEFGKARQCAIDEKQPMGDLVDLKLCWGHFRFLREKSTWT